MEIRVDPARAAPPARQLVEGVLDLVAREALDAGDRLPSVRGLAAEVLVNPNTVGKAYRQLEALGVVEGRRGAGVFVTGSGPRIARVLRRAETLERLDAAIEGALAAGHDTDVVRERVERWLEDEADCLFAPVAAGEER